MGTWSDSKPESSEASLARGGAVSVEELAVLVVAAAETEGRPGFDVTVFDVSLAVGMVVGFVASLVVRSPVTTFRRYRRAVQEAVASDRPDDVVRRDARSAFFRMMRAVRLNLVLGTAVGAAAGALVGWILSLL